MPLSCEAARYIRGVVLRGEIWFASLHAGKPHPARNEPRVSSFQGGEQSSGQLPLTMFRWRVRAPRRDDGLAKLSGELRRWDKGIWPIVRRGLIAPAMAF